jgi:hypothetical protein
LVIIAIAIIYQEPRNFRRKNVEKGLGGDMECNVIYNIVNSKTKEVIEEGSTVLKQGGSAAFVASLAEKVESDQVLNIIAELQTKRAIISFELEDLNDGLGGDYE